jgi:hypothetical protein
MNTLRVIYHLARADFLERTRRYSFLVILGLVVFLGYQVGVGNVGLKLGQYRGEFNSAWVGGMMSLIASVFLGWFGYYVINSSIARDRETGVGQIMATTPMTRVLYVIGKWISNFIVLAAMVAILALAGIAIQLLQGENMQLDMFVFLQPFIIIVLPMIALIAAIAVLFETIPFLSGGFGNIVYFFLFVLFIALVNQVSVNPAMEPTGVAIMHEHMTADLLKIHPNYEGAFTLGSGRDQNVTDTFLWNGVKWTPLMLFMRFSLFGVALVIIFIAALCFNRFDPSRTKPRRVKVKSPSPAQKVEPIPQPASTSNLTPLKTSANQINFSTALFAEIKLLIKGQRWWWYLVAGGLIIAGFVNPSTTARTVILPMAWVWPVLLWSSIGCRETHHNLHQIVFSSPSPVWRQLPAKWLAGFLVALGMASGAILRLGLAGDGAGLVMVLSGAVFIPSLALASGVWSGGNKLFEVLYVLIWYLGPLNRMSQLDYIGTTGESRPLSFILVSLALLALAVVGRNRQLRNG